MVQHVPGVAGFEPFFQDQPQRFVQAVGHVDRRGVVIDALLAPVLGQHRDVEIPALHLGLAPSTTSMARSLKRDRRQARRTAQALLRAGINRVDLPAVDFDRHAAQRRHGVDQQQCAGVVDQIAKSLRSAARRRSRFRP